MSLSDGHVIDEKLFELPSEAPTKWSVHMLPVLNDLLAAFTFENSGSDFGSFRLTVINVASGQITVRDSIVAEGSCSEAVDTDDVPR